MSYLISVYTTKEENRIDINCNNYDTAKTYFKIYSSRMLDNPLDYKEILWKQFEGEEGQIDSIILQLKDYRHD